MISTVYSNYVLELSIVMGILYGYYWLFMKQEKWYQINRFYLLGACILAIILPMIEIELSFLKPMSSWVEWGISLQEVLISEHLMEVAAEDKESYLLYIYFLGVGLSLLFFLIRLLKLIYFIRHATPIRSNSSYSMIFTKGKVPTSSFLHFLFWDETTDLGKKQQDQLIAHELCHIRERHSWDLLFMQLIQIVLWFHPLVYLIHRDLIQTHEYIADRKALQQSDPDSYQELLLSQMFGRQLAYTHSFFHQPLKNRIMMLHKQSSRKISALKYGAILPLILVLGFTISCTNEQVVEETLVSVKEKTSVIQLTGEEIPDPKPINMQEVQKEIGYPQELRDEGIQGEVLIKVMVNTQGKYVKHEVVKSPNDKLTAAVVKHIDKIRFDPADKDGKKVSFWATIPFRFKLLN